MSGFVKSWAAQAAAVAVLAAKVGQRLTTADKGGKADCNGLAGTDNRAAINAALTAGRAAYMLNGPHYVAGAVDVIANASLVGDDTLRMGQPGNWINGAPELQHGTTIFTDAGKGNAAGDPAFRLRVGSLVKNLNIWNPGQTKADAPASIVPYAPTFIIGQAPGVGAQNSDNAMVENVAALNCYEFMRIGNGVDSVGRTVVRNFYANPLYKGITVNSINGDMFHLEDGYIENIFLTNPTDRPALFEHIRRNVTAYDFDDAQGGTGINLTALCMGVGFKVNPRTWVHLVNPVADQCARPFWINGADRVSIVGGASVNNFKLGGPSMFVEGVINAFSVNGHVFGAHYEAIKVGVYSTHSVGTVKLGECTFENSFPAVLNAGAGAVQIDSCGVDYDRVVGKNISIDGGPAIKAGAAVPLANLNPSAPAPQGWSLSSAAPFTAIPGGVQVQGAGSYAMHYRPANVSVDNLDLLRWSNGLFVLEFDYYVTGQGGAAAMQMEVLDDNFAVVCDMFQICAETGQSSGFPEGETIRMAVILPWNVGATLLHFSFNNQDGNIVHRLSNFAVHKLDVSRGFTGLEFFKWAKNLPAGHVDAHTGKQVVMYGAAPAGGTWSVGDTVINPVPVAGGPLEWKCVAAPATFAVSKVAT